MEMREKHEYCHEKVESHLYKIGLFAQMNHTTVKTLRFYEERGLLKPAYVDQENGYRYYTLNQMATLHQITALKQAGFTLDDIGHISDKLQFLELDETEAACIFHRGSYEDFPKTYAVLLHYIEDNGYEIVGSIRESYIDGIWNKDTEEEWLSEIQIPVRSR